MKVAILEDENLSAEHLINLLKRIDKTIEVIKVIDSVKQATEYLNSIKFLDLLFVDIHLADGISFDIFSKIDVETPVIFTTAYNEYAIKAFKINSVDYLLKPVGIEELRAALNKFRKLNSASSFNAEKISSAISLITKQHKTRFMVKMGEHISSCKVEDISHFIAEDKIVLLVNKDGKRYPLDYTIDTLETLINPDLFFRINRKVLLHIDSILQVHTYFNSRLKVQMKHIQGDECIVSRERVNDFKIWLDK